MPRPSAEGRCATAFTPLPPTSTSTSRARWPISARRARCTTRCSAATPATGRRSSRTCAGSGTSRRTARSTPSISGRASSSTTAPTSPPRTSRRPTSASCGRPKGIVIPRTPLFTTVSEIVVLDPHRIEFRLSEPRPRAFMLGAFASGWNIIVRKKTLDDNQGNLRQVMNYPGTGPFKPRLAEGQGSLDHGEEPQLLEQGAPVRRQARDLPLAAVLAGAGRGVPVRQARLRPAAGSDLLAQGQGDARRHRAAFSTSP